MINDARQLLERVRAYGLNLEADRLELDQSGLDFYALHAHADRDGKAEHWIVKTPRHPKAYEGAVNEAKILALLRRRLSVAVPDWRVCEPDVIAYPSLPGTPAWTYDPEKGLVWNGIDVAHPQVAFVESTARFLAALHAIPQEDVAAAGGRVSSVAAVREKHAAACRSTRALLRPSDAVWQRWQAWLDDDSYWPVDVALVHGDLHPGHMLLDDSLRLVGVLDWTEAEMADPAVDFSIFFGCFGAACLSDIIQRYGAAGGKVHPRLAAHVAERWAAYAPLVAAWGLANGNEGVVEHAKATLAAVEKAMNP